MLQQQASQPYLIFLAACQSATHALTAPFAGLGPKLSLAGIPAVITMQDRIAIEALAGQALGAVRGKGEACLGSPDVEQQIAEFVRLFVEKVPARHASPLPMEGASGMLPIFCRIPTGAV